MLKQLLHIIVFSFALFLAGSTAYGQSAGSSVGCNLFIPNAFTPNGDNINDRFEVGFSENCRLLEYEMKIFDRWGRLVYETKSVDPQEAWDGTSEGEEVQKGVYMWNVYGRAVPFNGGDPEPIKRQGTVVLIR